MTRIFMAIAVSGWALAAQAQTGLSKISEHVLMHVLTNEMGHALIREFDLPVLANEEVAADQFATYMLHRTLPDRVGDIVRARFQSFMIEGDDESPFSEYPDDARRAGYTLCFLYGLNPERHQAMAQEFGMTADEGAACRDTSSEIARSWRRILAPLAMPPEARVSEVAVIFGDGPWKTVMEESEVTRIVYDMLRGIDWHSQITLHFDHCDAGARWQRNGRRIQLCDALIERFEEQARARDEG